MTKFDTKLKKIMEGMVSMKHSGGNVGMMGGTNNSSNPNGNPNGNTDSDDVSQEEFLATWKAANLNENTPEEDEKLKKWLNRPNLKKTLQNILGQDFNNQVNTVEPQNTFS